MSRQGPRAPERSFGLSVGGVLCAIAVYSAWCGRPVRADVFGGLGGFLVFFGLVYPPVLKVPSAIWWAVARFLGYVSARVWLTVLFALVIVPMGAIWRITGKDPLARRRSRESNWSPYPSRYRDPRHYSRMY